ncbi:hypothetical protein NA56DRAFT_387215 [Hyaloscypha hepaticicola]|uniref:Uncharacterized protein n=1 Tax=Hyaloscypha hepaticicola TaxID=2082293 RepID=A0A2J6QHU2_9HELO|nr:hypothetical protein NA56DRAFT_387215 [Hyaloscypha hepaticicola]
MKIAKSGVPSTPISYEDAAPQSSRDPNFSSDSSEDDELARGIQSSTAADVIVEINALISRLQRIYSAIRKESKDNRNKRIASFQIIDPADLELQDDLERLSISLLKIKYAQSSDSFRELLLDTILLRQKRFLYAARRHSNNIARALSFEDEGPPVAFQQSTPPSQAVSPSQPRPEPGHTSAVISYVTDLRRPPRSLFTATTLENRPLKLTTRHPKPSAKSVRSLLQDGKLAWPPPPKHESWKLDCRCPYCFDFLTEEEILDKALWQTCQARCRTL